MGNEAYQLQGQNGGSVFIDTTAHTAPVNNPWSAVLCVVETVFTAIDSTDSIPVDLGDLSTLTIPAGVTIFGRITSLQLTSGAVIAYY